MNPILIRDRINFSNFGGRNQDACYESNERLKGMLRKVSYEFSMTYGLLVLVLYFRYSLDLI